MPPKKPDDLPLLAFPSAEKFGAWLRKHLDERGLWLKIAKKDSGIPSVTYSEAVDEALCVGWIDGQRKAVDDDWFKQRFTPRTRTSKWSKINRERVAALERAGRMRPSGRAAVDAAKADGRWEAAYSGQRTITVPDDLAAALDADPVARNFFATLSGSKRYAFLYRIGAVKKPETRARKIALYVAMLREHRTLHS